MFTMGSLFDGSGGFPLAALMCGGVPVWASEIEPYPIAVTRSRFPKMKHLGDISKISGAEIQPVDVVTFGSPCQDLSVAGKRAGLKHEDNGDEETTRSGLFIEAVRIIKEMRNATNGTYPRFALWENVPGAFSSNKGEDFRTVLEEIIKIVEPSAVMPTVPKAGWSYADSYCGGGWSLAYRVLDAQYWGVPQRRRRIYLVADFRGERAREVLFEREGLRGYFAQGSTPWQGITADVKGCTGADDCTGEGNCLTPLDVQSRRIFSVDGSWPSLYGGEGGRNGYACIPYPMKIRSGCEGGDKGALIQTDKSATLSTLNDQYLFQPVPMAYSFDSLSSNSMKSKNPHSGCRQTETAKTLDCFDPSPAKNQGGIAVLQPVINSAGFKSGQGAKARSIGWEEEKSPSLAAESGGNSVPSVCIQKVLPFDTTQVTSPQNGCNPKFGDPCHPLAAQGHPPAVICKCFDSSGNGDGETVNTITGDHESRITDYTSVVVEENPVFCIQGNSIDRSDNAGCNGKGFTEGVSYTLNTIDRPAISYIARGKETVGTIMANAGTKLFLGNQEAFSGDYHIIEKSSFRYIVRRLTPTECARLQGFPDFWGHPNKKDNFTDEEYRFWLAVRNTYAAINGKLQKDYSKEQMLTWYNKLHTDSSEYKMWGNGIALPTALYVMQGIADYI